MGFAVNKVILVGNLGKDPEIRTLDNGTKLASFTIATTERYKDKNGDYQDSTEWHRITAWRWLADIAEKSLKIGSKVYIEGKLNTRSYEQDGVTKYVTEIIAKELITMSRNEGGNYVPPPNQEPQSKFTANKLDEELAKSDEGEDTDNLPF